VFRERNGVEFEIGEAELVEWCSLFPPAS